MTRTPSTPDRADDDSPNNRASDPSAREIELLHVLVSRTGTHVDAQWGIHPQLKHDLLPNEWKEVTDLMAKVTDIVGHRFAQVLSRAESTSSGHA